MFCWRNFQKIFFFDFLEISKLKKFSLKIKGKKVNKTILRNIFDFKNLTSSQKKFLLIQISPFQKFRN